MPDRFLEAANNALLAAVLVVLGAWAGLIRYLGSIKGVAEFSWYALLVSLITAPFVTLLIGFWLADEGYSLAKTLLIAGFAGNASTLVIQAVNAVLVRRLQAWIGEK